MVTVLTLNDVIHMKNEWITAFLTTNYKMSSNDLRNRLMTSIILYNISATNPNSPTVLDRNEYKYVIHRMFKTLYLLPIETLQFITCGVTSSPGSDRISLIKAVIDKEYNFPYNKISYYGTPTRLLGKGQYGKVVLFTKGSEKYAIKFTNEEYEIDVSTIREIASVRSVNQENIVKFIDVGFITADDPQYIIDDDDDNNYNIFIVMKVAEDNLDNMIMESRIPSDHKVKISHEIASGIHYYLNNNIINRDLKPSNILIEGGHVPKAVIADFGLARVNYCPYTDHLLTGGLYTIWYRAPEVALGSTKYGSEAEVWAYGCILYELFTGEPLFKEYNVYSLLHNIFSVTGTPNYGTWPDVVNLPGWQTTDFPQLPSSSAKFDIPQITAFPYLRELLLQIFVNNPHERITMYNILNHQFFNDYNKDHICTLSCDDKLRIKMYYPSGSNDDRDRVLDMLCKLYNRHKNAEGLALAIHYYDTIASKIEITDENIKPIVYSCFSLATKIGRNNVTLVDLNRSTDQVLAWEKQIVKMLDWKLAPSTSIDFYHAYKQFYSKEVRKDTVKTILLLLKTQLPFVIEPDQLALTAIYISCRSNGQTFRHDHKLTYDKDHLINVSHKYTTRYTESKK